VLWLPILLFVSACASEPREKLSEYEQALSKEQANLIGIIDLAQTGQYKNLLPRIKAVVSAPNFTHLRKSEQFAGLWLLAAALYEAKDKGAHEIAFQASLMDEANGAIWLLRLYTAPSEDMAEKLHCVATIAERWPNQLADINPFYIAGLLNQTREVIEVQTVRIRTLRAIHDDGWPRQSADSATVFEPDYLWLDLIDDDLAHDNVQSAEAIAASVDNPQFVIRLRIDKRYDSISTKLGDHIDVARAQAAYLEKLKMIAASQPKLLRAVNLLSKELISQNRPVEAKALLDDALARIRSEPPNSKAFSDTDNELNWTLDRRATILDMLGESDEAISYLARAAAMSENGTQNVSQSINLGDYYNALGRPADALAAVAAVHENLSPYGLMQLQEVRTCAYAQLNDAMRYKESLQAMRDHIVDAPASVQRALLCADDETGAAGVLIDRLADPMRRTAALVDAQTYLDPPHQPPFDREVQRRLNLVLKRPDVMAAVEAVGRIESQPRLPAQY
jgi:tetratricopeptide (TPR) repeat protein